MIREISRYDSSPPSRTVSKGEGKKATRYKLPENLRYARR